MKEIFYNKLVRDRIPEICRQENEIAKFRVLNEKNFKKELKKKLLEESKELVKANEDELIYEIADVYEVLLYIAKTAKISWPEVEKARQQKNKKRGSFKKKLFLISSKK